MKHRRIPGRRAVAAGAGIAALVAGGVTLQSANASENTPAPEPKVLSVAAAGKLASTLGKDLGGDAAGTFYDAKAKSLVVNVLDEAAADTVESAGARARVVENSLADLRSARTTLKQDATIPGTSWALDPATNKVVVTADRTVTGAELTRLTKVVDGLGGTTELKRTKGEFRTFVAGGDAITGGGGRCSLGFNVVKGGEPFFLTAGHCTEGIATWSDSSGTEIGENADSSFPDNDYGLVKYTADVDHPSEVNRHPERVHDPGARRVGDRSGRDRELRQRRHRQRAHPDRCLRGAGGQRWVAVLGEQRDRAHVRWQW